MKGKTVCYHHGGKSPRGVASPSLKHGGYSIDLPTRLQSTYIETQNDPQLLDLSADLALNRAFMQDALSGLDSGESGRLWKALKATWSDLQRANRDKDGEAARLALNELGTLINHGYGATAAREESVDLSERRRKLVESEQKRRVAMQDMIDSKQAMMLVVRLTEAVMRHVDDPRTLAAISAEFGAITTHDGTGSS
ncbi:MAG: hypothetical protein ACR2OE_15545 [Thermomicrobiales bacterium]